MSFAEWFNLGEGFLWVAISAAFFFVGWRRGRLSQLVVPAVAFFVFGISDWIEMRTGAWWRPWWLLLMKGVCVTTFALLGIRLWRKQRASSKAQETEAEEGA